MSFDYFEHRNIYRVLHDLESQKSCRNGSVNSMRAYPSRAFVWNLKKPHCTDITFRFQVVLSVTGGIMQQFCC